MCCQSIPVSPIARTHPYGPASRTDGVYVLPGHDSHSRRERPRHQEQVVPHCRRSGNSENRGGRSAGDSGWAFRRLGLARARRQTDVCTRVFEPGRGQDPDQNKSKWRFAGNEELTPGKRTIAFDFAHDGGGIGKGGSGTLTVDGKKVAEGRNGEEDGAFPVLPGRKLRHRGGYRDACD